MGRTLNADLTTAQQAPSARPFMQLVFHSKGRANTRSYKTTDTPNRILQVQQAEGRFGSYTLVEGRPFIISSVIRLQNSDQSLNNTDFKGYRVYIEWGFHTASGIKTSRGGPEFVISQEYRSEQGVNYLELYTVNLWELANTIFVNVANDFPLSYVNGGLNSTDVKNILLELLGGGKLDAALLSDNAVYTDSTSDSENPDSSAFGLFPATPVANQDFFYFGQSASVKFDRISIDVTQILSSGSITLTWQYSLGNGAGGAWGTLNPLTQSEGATARSHIDFTSTGLQIEAFDIPSDWVTDTIDSKGPFFYIRAAVTGVSSPVTQIQAKRIFAGLDFAFALDTTESTQGDDFKPTYTSRVDSTLGAVIEDILAFTLMGIRAEEDGFHAAFIDAAQVTPDETYNFLDGPHRFFVYSEGQQVTVPNRILVVSSDIENGAATFSGTSDDTSAQAELRIIPKIVVDASITSNAEALTQADRIIAQLKRDKMQGRAEVPMQVAQEVWDEVRIVDDRASGTVDGRVSQVIRLYQAGTYRMQIIMGGKIWAVDLPEVSDAIVPEFLTSEGEVQPSVRTVPRPTVLSVPDPRIVPTPVPMTVRPQGIVQGGPNIRRRELVAAPSNRAPVQESLMSQRARRLQGPTEPGSIGPRELVESVMARRVRERRERRTNRGR